VDQENSLLARGRWGRSGWCTAVLVVLPKSGGEQKPQSQFPSD